MSPKIFASLKSFFSKTKNMLYSHILNPLLTMNFITNDTRPACTIVRVPHSYFNVRRNQIQLRHFKGKSFLHEKNSSKDSSRIKKIKKIRKARENFRRKSSLRSQIFLESTIRNLKFDDSDNSSISSISARSQPISESGKQDISDLLSVLNSQTKPILESYLQQVSQQQSRMEPPRQKPRNVTELLSQQLCKFDKVKMNRKIQENNEYLMNKPQKRCTIQAFINDRYRRDPWLCPPMPSYLQRGEMMEEEIQQRDDKSSCMQLQ